MRVRDKIEKEMKSERMKCDETKHFLSITLVVIY